MTTLRFGACALVAALALVSLEPEAHACGGCFAPTPVQQSRSTQVTAHRMLLSISQDATTLWDQIEYVGAPAEFAWVLPIKGQVTIGLSSEATFNMVDELTVVQLVSPTVYCGGGTGSGFGPGTCSGPSTAYAASAGGGGMAGGEPEPVTIVAHEVVGPYETVQLSSQDPTALLAWLASHGYQVPSDVQPIVSAYVSEGFDFLALKLVPGIGVDAMRPVRVTLAGAVPTLPLRMVAAGTGAFTAISLVVFGEGRYQAANFPNGEIAPATLVWDFDSQSSNYRQLRESMWASNQSRTWLTESARPVSAASIRQSVLALATSSPAASGYGDGNPSLALAEATADMDALLGTLAASDVWAARLTANSSRAALANDLLLEAAPQVELPAWLEIQTYTGNPCPGFFDVAPDCHDGSGSGGGFGARGDNGWGDSCAASGRPGAAWAGAVVVALALALRRRGGGAAGRTARARRTASSIIVDAAKIRVRRAMSEG